MFSVTTETISHNGTAMRHYEIQYLDNALFVDVRLHHATRPNEE